MLIVTSAHAATPAAPQGSHTGVAHDDHGKGGAFPAFDTTTYPSQLLWLAITFGLLYYLMSKVALPKIAGILEDRRDRVADDLAEAERFKAKSDAAIASYEKALGDARARAQALATEARDKLVAEADEKRKVLEARLAADIAAAEARINATKADAMVKVRDIAVDAAGSIVEKLTGRSASAADIAAAVDAAQRG